MNTRAMKQKNKGVASGTTMSEHVDTDKEYCDHSTTPTKSTPSPFPPPFTDTKPGYSQQTPQATTNTTPKITPPPPAPYPPTPVPYLLTINPSRG